jgi:serine/threonine protein kinase
MLSLAACSDPQARASFVAEMSLLKSLRHDNVLRFVGIFCKEDKVGMELKLT